MKCFERLVMAHINSSLPSCLDPLQFAYRCNRSTVDAMSLALHSSLEPLDNTDTFVRLLLINYSSAFNTIIPSNLISKLYDLGLSSALCNWVLSFLTHWLQSVRIGPISNNNESEYRKKIEGLVLRYNDNNLFLNVGKTKELIIDFRKKEGEHAPIYINETEVERVESIKFLRGTIANNLSWTP
eukprot:g23700.t1